MDYSCLHIHNETGEIIMEKLTNWLRLVADAYDSVGDNESALYGYQSADAIELQQQTIVELYATLDSVLHHTSTDTIAEAEALIERVKAEAKWT